MTTVTIDVGDVARATISDLESQIRKKDKKIKDLEHKLREEQGRTHRLKEKLDHVGLVVSAVTDAASVLDDEWWLRHDDGL